MTRVKTLPGVLVDDLPLLGVSPLLVSGTLQVPELLSDVLPDGLNQVLSVRVRNELDDLHKPLDD